MERRQEEGLPMDLSYAAITHMLDPFYCTYFCKDGRPLYLVAPCHEIQQRRTLQALGIWDEMVADGLPQVMGLGGALYLRAYGSCNG